MVRRKHIEEVGKGHLAEIRPRGRLRQPFLDNLCAAIADLPQPDEFAMSPFAKFGIHAFESDGLAIASLVIGAFGFDKVLHAGVARFDIGVDHQRDVAGVGQQLVEYKAAEHYVAIGDDAATLYRGRR